jgi:hypothetical protein
MKNIFVKATTEPSQVYLIKEKATLGLTSKNPEAMEHYGSGTHNQHVYITKKESYDRGDWCIDIEAEEIFKVAEVKEFSGIVRSDTDTYVYDACVKIVLATDLKLVADGVKEINSEFLEWFVKNSSCEEVDIEAYCPNDCNGCVEKCKNSFYRIIPKGTPKTFKELFANTGIEPTTDESGNIQYNFKATMKEGIDFGKELSKWGYNKGNSIDVEILVNEILPDLFKQFNK